MREFLLIVCLIQIVHFANVARAENWDRFRGPNGAGQSDAEGIPSEWKTENFLWRMPLPGIGHSSPVIWDGRLYITSADGDTREQIIQAYDAIGGSLLWERRVDAGSYSINGLNSYASSTPAVDAHHLYVMWLANGRVMLAAWTHDGDEVWRRDIGGFEEEHGFGKSPVVVDGLVCVANDNETDSAIVALDALSGDPRWHILRASGITPFATPCVLDPDAEKIQLLALSTASGLSAIDVQTGQVAWHGLKDELPLRTVSSPIVAGGLIFVSCGQGGNGKLTIAARPGNAQVGPREVYRLEQNIPNVPTPVVAGDLLFLWHDRGVVSCHDVGSGRQLWRNRVGGDFHSSPVRIGDRIFAASRAGEVVVLRAAPEFQLLARNVLDEPCHATPAVAENRLYVRTESTLFCIGSPVSAKD
ncbi:MAG: PQQ-binding-like beta-propeller repeat protein [Planctomycetes bacterium]|nr:PQQ-binding-like beta-propeller repeat protein [Planctomycetota bacterium]